MFNKKMLVLVGLLVLTAFAMTACAGPQGPEGPAGAQGPAGPQGEPGQMPAVTDLSCTECHNDTALITSKKAAWSISVHGTGEGKDYAGERGACAGCHSGAAFSQMIAEGKNFSQVESATGEPTHQDCRTCHQVHTSYTGEDWALETTAPVTLVTSGATFDGGAGNLCANCHQARRYLAGFVDKTDPTKYAATVRFNTHYSVQVDTLMGLGDFGVEGKPGAHYNMVEDTCVACHMGDGQVHTFRPQLAKCQECHADAEDFNVNGFLTTFEEKLLELEAALLAKGMIEESAEEPGTYATVPGTYDAGPAQAMFIYHLIHEDKSDGIHNPVYFTALIEHALEMMK